MGSALAADDVIERDGELRRRFADPRRPSFATSSLIEADDRNRTFYEEHADAYARATLALPVDERLAVMAAHVGLRGPVLDLGCGAGRDLSALRRLGVAAVGLERSRALALVAARESSAPVVMGDLRRLPFGRGDFAGVWASASLLHLARRELPRALAGIAAALRSGGSLMLSVKRGRGSRTDVDGRTFTLYEPGELRARLEGAGLRDVAVSVDDLRGREPTRQPSEWLRAVATLR